jgi:hypothetical protein
VAVILALVVGAVWMFKGNPDRGTGPNETRVTTQRSTAPATTPGNPTATNPTKQP